MTNKEKLVSFLDTKAFNPILKKKESDFSRQRLEKFEDVKQSTEKEKQRFHEKYSFAEEV